MGGGVSGYLHSPFELTSHGKELSGQEVMWASRSGRYGCYEICHAA
jgi:hypothetical protein